MKMRVCFVSHSSEKWGAEKALLELIEALEPRGVEPYVLLPSYGPLIEELQKRQITYRVLPYKWWVGRNVPAWKRMLRAFFNLALLIPVLLTIKRWKCQIVYTNTIAVSIGAVAAKLLGLPHVWHIHEFGKEDHGFVFDFHENFSLWLMDRFSEVWIANSHAVAEKYQQYTKPSKLKVVYHSVSVPEVVSELVLNDSGDDIEEGMKCVIVGRLEEGKRQEDAIRAVGKLVREGIKVKLYVVGKGSGKYENYLRRLVKDDNLEGYVVLVGHLEDPFPLMKNSHVLLMCSRSEAFGRVTVEAMKLGKPVIGARSGGTVELIRDGFNGFLYTPGSYEELSNKIRYLYENPDIVDQMGKNALQWAEEHFTPELYGEGVMKILRLLVNR